MKPPIEFRPTGLRKYLETGKKSVAFDGRVRITAEADWKAMLIHKRALKAAQMRRWRAKKAKV